MASPFSLSKGKKDKSGSAEYNTLLKKNMARYKDRDEAVRKTNIASGYGSSTAQRFMHEGGGGGGKTAPSKSGGGADKKPQKKKSGFSLPKEAPVPTSRPPSYDPLSSANTGLPPAPQQSYPYPPAPQQSYPYPPVEQPQPSYPYPPAPPAPPYDPLSSANTGTPAFNPLAGANTGQPAFNPLAGANTGTPAFNPLSGPNTGAQVRRRPVVDFGQPTLEQPLIEGGGNGPGQPLISTPPADPNASWIRKLLGLA